MKRILKKVLGKKLSCKLGLHTWKVIKSIKLSNIVFLVRKHHSVLEKVNYIPDKDYIVYDKECRNCKLQDFDIDITKKLIIEKLNTVLTNKIKN